MKFLVLGMKFLEHLTCFYSHWYKILFW
jgi:hypothetical protein